MDKLSYPKLRAVDHQWIEHGGQPAMLLQDRLGIGAQGVVVPRLLVPLLVLCDGSRTLSEIQVALESEWRVSLPTATIESALSHLDQALLLENERFAEGYRLALDEYRAAPSRPTMLAGESYPSNPQELSRLLDRHLAEAVLRRGARAVPSHGIRGLICPHIDYDRGGPVYAQLWDRARHGLEEADSFIVLGTDHAGGPGELTLTRQSFETPLGLLETDREAVDTVVEAMGPRAAFASELNHRVEHSLELALVWLRHLTGDRPIRILPVLCGSFHPFTHDNGHPSDIASWRAAAGTLRRLAQRDRTMVIAAADLAHVGPAFGAPQPIGLAERGALYRADQETLAAVCRGDSEGFLDILVKEKDQRNVCGLPPIYLALSILGQVAGEVVDYSICPAPAESAVSIAGVILSTPSS